MKDFLKKHSTQATYTTWAASNNYITPNVSLIEADSSIIYNPYIAPVVQQHDYVEIGGIKWATMNLGANSITDGGLYYQWGDTQGYSSSQVGDGEGQKLFDSSNYKYYNDDSYTKYNNEDGLITLLPEDDAVTAAWGGNWRMPTGDEFMALGEAVNTEWTNNYQNSGVAGLICVDKTDNTKILFFPAIGYIQYNDYYSNDGYGVYWSSSLDTIYTPTRGISTYFSDSESITWGWRTNNEREVGCAIRGILDDSNS